jgi:hypothetical protein
MIAGLVGMIGAGINPVPNHVISIASSASFQNAFVAITNPVFAYAGHFMFFILISEMRHPQDAMKAAYVLQAFATSFYVLFAIVTYYYIGNDVASPSFSSLPIKWQKAAFAIALPNFLIAGSLYSHTAAKLVFLRLFRNSKHLHSHSLIGWGTWTVLVFIMSAAAFVLAVAVPIFSYLIGIAAALFASWYTYGIAGAFWLHDAYCEFPANIIYAERLLTSVDIHGAGTSGWRRSPLQFILCVLTVLAGAFICIAGTYVTVKLIVDAYNSGGKSTSTPPYPLDSTNPRHYSGRPTIQLLTHTKQRERYESNESSTLHPH